MVGILDIIAFALIILSQFMERQCVEPFTILALKSDIYILSRRPARLQVKAA
ncbi:hypothetical protein D3C85_1820930 [compost metagenome]